MTIARRIIGFSAVLALCSIFLFPAMGRASTFDPLKPACDEVVRGAGEPAVCEESRDASDRITGSEGVILSVANVVAIVGGIAAVIIIIVSGIQLTLSGGEPEKVRSKRNAIIYTAIGIVVIVLARSLIAYVINAVD